MQARQQHHQAQKRAAGGRRASCAAARCSALLPLKPTQTPTPTPNSPLSVPSYDIGIAGGVVAMPEFQKKFFPHVRPPLPSPRRRMRRSAPRPPAGRRP